MDYEPTVRGVTASDAAPGVEALASDRYLGPLVAEHGKKTLEPAPDFFHRFMVSITRQQLSMAAAAAIMDRLENDVRITPAAILQADYDVLRATGLSEMKLATMRRIAEQFVTGSWSRDRFAGQEDAAVTEKLTAVRGVGIWTAKMQLMFSLGRTDVFPVEDLGIRRGMHTLVDDDLTRNEMTEIATRWAPHRSVASLYLWELGD